MPSTVNAWLPVGPRLRFSIVDSTVVPSVHLMPAPRQRIESSRQNHDFFAMSVD